MTTARRLTALVVALRLGVGRAHAQCPGVPSDAFAFINAGNTPCPTDPGVSWPGASVVFDCSALGAGDTIVACAGDPSRCVQLCQAAAKVWNTDLTGRFTFVDG